MLKLKRPIHKNKSLRIGLSFIATLSLLYSSLNLIFRNPNNVYASSPWTQTDWSGGDGQTSWLDETEYSSGSNVNHATSGQLSLAANSGYQTHWGEGFKYHKKLTFDNSAQAENLANFPVLVKLTSSNFDFSKAQSAGQDIRFVDSDDSTTLSYEIEKWDVAGQEADIWVKVPQVDASSSTDFIYMYYGSSSAADGQNAAGVWDSNYVMVQHLKENSGTTTSDSTSNGNNGTKVSATSPNPTSSGKINGAQNFNGTSDNISIANSLSLNVSSKITMAAWINVDSVAPYRFILIKNTSATNGSTGSPWNLFVQSGGVPTLVVWVGGVMQRIDGITPLTIGSFVYVVATYDSTTGLGSIYINGVLDNSLLQAAGTIDSNDNNLLISSPNTAPTRFFDGIIDEVRISNTARSAAWTAAEYASMNNSFVTYGTETQFTWWGSAWKYREKITFDNSAQAENLVNFPALVKLNSSRINYSLTKDSGEDIRFSDADGITTLPYEIEKWDETGDSFVWVKVPQIDASSATDYIYLYFGNSSASDSQTPTSVWDSNYVSVHHLGETTGNHQDSTSNNIDSTTTTVSVQGSAPGSADGADEFVSGNYVDLGNVHSYESTSCGNQTWSIWFKTNQTQTSDWNGGRLIAYMPTGSSGEGWYELVLNPTGNITTTNRSRYGTSKTITSQVGGYNDGQWHQASFIFNTTTYNYKLYVDGQLDGETSFSSWVGPLYCSWPSYDYYTISLGLLHTAYLGGYDVGKYVGTLDEPRISNVIRSASWIAAEYKSMMDTFNTHGSIEGQYQPSGSLISSIYDTAQSSNWGTFTYNTSGTGTVAVKARTSNSATMEGATDWGSCEAVSNGSDMSSHSCVTDGDRYVQYQASLSTSDPSVTPVLEDISLDYTLNTSPTGSVSINSGATYTNSTAVTLTLSATDDLDEAASLQMMLANDSSFTDAVWESYATTKSWTLSSTDGTKTVYIKFKDTAGNVSEAYSDSIILDTTAPTDEISINSGTTYTKTREVTLTIDATDVLSVVSQMMVSEQAGLSDGTWESYAATKSWTLSSGDGTKTVYVKFKDTAGNISEVYSDSIIYDSNPPSGEITINSNATYAKTRDVTLTINASDVLSGVSQMMVSEDSAFTGASWETYATTRSWTLSSGDGTKTVYIKFKDTAGNISSIFHDSIILDTTVPVTLLKLGGADFNSDIALWETTSQRPTFSGTTDPNATVTITINSETTIVGTATADAAGVWSWTPATDISPGTYTVTVTSQDPAGNTRSLSFSLIVKGTTADTTTTLPNTGIPIALTLLTILFFALSGWGTKLILKLQNLLSNYKAK